MSGEHLMPAAPPGFETCRVHDGSQDLMATGAARQVTHLVALDAKGSNGGRPTVCGLSRFDRRDDHHRVVRRADLSGWSMGGGVSGPGVVQVACEGCFDPAAQAAGAPGRGPDRG